MSGGFSPRDSLRIVKYRDMFWLSNGYYYGGVNLRDLWVSSNGFDFALVNGNTPYRPYAPICVHEGKLYAVDDTGVRSSVDGAAWTVEPVVGTFPWAPEKPLYSLNGDLTLITGEKVCTLSGGEVREYPVPFRKRSYFASVELNGRIYVMGGADDSGPPVRREAGYPGYKSLNDVWSTGDPTDYDSWVCHTRDAGWRPRMWPAACVHNGKIWMVGGYDNQRGNGINFGDTWAWDPDGGNDWERPKLAAELTPRHAPALYAVKDRLVVAAGNNNVDTNVLQDVWELAE